MFFRDVEVKKAWERYTDVISISVKQLYWSGKSVENNCNKFKNNFIFEWYIECYKILMVVFLFLF